MEVFILEDAEIRVEQFKRGLVGNNVTVTDRADEALRILSEKRFDLIYLDHDLGGDTMVDANPDWNTGTRVAKNFDQCPLNRDARIIIHSLNPDGSATMKAYLDNHGCGNVYLQPFAWQML